MHIYSIDSNEREHFPLYIAIISIFAAWGLFRILEVTQLSLPWWIHAPSVMGIYGLFYSSFDKWLWRRKFMRQIGLVKFPDLNGIYEGYVASSFDSLKTEYKASLEILQSWTQISIILKTENSVSHSLMATISKDDPNGTILSYEYINEPKAHADKELHIHRGTARLLIANNDLFEGEYYTGRDRLTFGKMHFERVK